MLLEDVRKLALSLPEVHEEPHFHMTSFRTGKKMFATAPPGDQYLHLFVGDEDRDRAMAMEPEAFENLMWGKKVAGLRVLLEKASPPLVWELTYIAWTRKAPKKLVASFGDAWRDALDLLN